MLSGDFRRYQFQSVVIATLLVLSALVVSDLASIPVAFVLSAFGITADSVVGYVVLIIEQEIVFGLVAVVYVANSDTVDFAVERPTIRTVGWIIVGSFALLGISQVVGFVFQQLGVTEGVNRIERIGREQPRLLLYLIPIAVLVIGPGEELLFRGGVQGLLRRSFSPVPAIIGASALFGVIHIPAVIGTGVGVGSYVVTTFVLGLILGALYEHTNRLLVPSLSHGIYNAILFAVLYTFSV